MLLRPDALPEDVAAFRLASAVVTTSGGLTCHATVIAHSLGLPALVGVSGVRIDAARGLVLGGRDTRKTMLREGDWVSVDARRGSLHRGRAELEPQLRDPELKRLFAEARRLRPTPLWVQGEARLALRIKDDAALDEALCHWPERGQLPQALGRECSGRDRCGRAGGTPAYASPRVGHRGVWRSERIGAWGPTRARAAPPSAHRLERADDALPEGLLDLLVVAFAGEVPAQKRAIAPRLLPA